jgi:large subunit ribosomal protein L32
MPVPKRKRSRARRDSRFANKGMKLKSFGGCPNCQAPLVPHSACKECGHYKGAKVLATKAERAVKRGEAKQAKESRQATSQPQESGSESNQ